MNGRIELHRYRRGSGVGRAFQWHAIDAKGRVVAERDGYPRRWPAKREARRLFPGWPIISV